MTPHFDPKDDRFLLPPTQIILTLRMMLVTDGIETDPLIPIIITCTQADYVHRVVHRKLVKFFRGMHTLETCVVWDEDVSPMDLFDHQFPGYEPDHPERTESGVLRLTLMNGELS